MGALKQAILRTFFRREYEKGSKIWAAATLRIEATGAFRPEQIPSIEDRQRLLLEEREMRAFVARYHDPEEFEYGEIHRADSAIDDNVPDCDDFSGAADYHICQRGVLAERLRRPPAFGRIKYRRHGRVTLHKANWGYWLREGVPQGFIYEPQTGRFITDIKAEAQSVIYLRIA